MKRKLLAPVLALLTLTPSIASAISIRPAISGGVSSAVVEHNDIGPKGGPTIGGEVLVGLTDVMFLGPSIQYSRFDVTAGSDEIEQLDIDLNFRIYSPQQRVRFFANLNVGYTRQTRERDQWVQDPGEPGGTVMPIAFTADGFGTGTYGGVALAAGPAAIELSFGLRYNHYGNFEADDSNWPDLEGASGFRFEAKAALVWPLGGMAR
jgi:hypothetical protein